MCLILINGQQGQCKPWATQDFDGLAARLPEIHEGAGKWIQILEQKTAECVLAIRDIKALLAKCVGGTKLNELLNDVGLRIAIDNIRRDKMTFAPFRKSTWTTIHREYPMQIDPKMLRGDPIGETENPTAYIQEQLKRWCEELEKDPEEDFVLAALFRKAIVEAVPPPVKTKLEDVVELNSKSHKEFCDHVSHAVKQHQKNELKATTAERDREMQRGLAKLQRDDFVSKTKKKAQAVLKEKQPALMVLINTPAPTIQQTQIATPAQPTPGNAQQQATLIVICAKPKQQNSRNGQKQQGGRGQGRTKRSRDRCWGCEDAGAAWTLQK
nr:uncharacterized protein LOC129435167 [Misgurnus anguillicaudatus]